MVCFVVKFPTGGVMSKNTMKKGLIFSPQFPLLHKSHLKYQKSFHICLENILEQT
jgi:hypothetical protein